ncbi:hypothetical protein CDD82_707 [Ophiocordyceps australis]|uniref:Uncharacterized protein n=1 Tax=Ophiocordyceps australis TaxID=1399860 RepID=A0A2C5YMS9_9HYPO|nr:hypothetical protein CDD82_707 [Ophiocordyceps australis]
MAALSHPHLPTPLADSPPAQANSNTLTTNSKRPSLSPRSSSTPRSSISDRSHDAPPPSATAPQLQQRPSITPVNPSKARRSSSNGLLNRAAAALDRTQSAIASLSDPVIRPRQSNSALARLSLSSTAPSVSAPISDPPSPEKVTIFNISSSQSLASISRVDRPLAHSPTAAPRPEPIPADPSPIVHQRPPVTRNKMHQTSSRLLRMTDDDRPFTRVGGRHHEARVH